MYERFFELVDTPFRLTPDPRYLFLSRKHEEALAHLRRSLSASSGFVCITGEVGTGKTTLLRAFVAELEPEVAVARVSNPGGSLVELLQRINWEFGLATSTASRTELVDALNSHLLAQSKRGRLSVIVIDEAQALSGELLAQLGLLCSRETAGEKLLRIVLVGQPQLRSLLLDPALAQLSQRITHRWHLGPLGSRETAQYVRHRLRIAGEGTNPRVFTRPALWLLHRLSGGVPRLINMIGNRAMLASFMKRRGTVTARFVLHGYRQIEAAALPRSASTRWRAAWMTGAVAVGASLLTLWAQRVQWRPVAWLPDAQEASQVSRAVAQPDTPQRPSESPEIPPLSPPVSELERRLTASPDARPSARAAVESILVAWRARPLAEAEMRGFEDFPEIARRRGLDHLVLSGDRSMLMRFDLPAILEVHPAGGPRYATLTRLSEQRAVFSIDGTPVETDVEELDRIWQGRAHVVWRDFENLGFTFGPQTQGPRIARLQELLRRAGHYTGAATGDYDDATEAAVLGFQRAHMLVVDGRVGRLTRIALYARVGGYQRPTLAGRSGARS